MVKEHGSRKQELVEAQAATSRYEEECRRLQAASESGVQADAAAASAVAAEAVALRAELEGARGEAARQSRLRDDLVSQISLLRDELRDAKLQNRAGATKAQTEAQVEGDERTASLRGELASVRASLASLEEEQRTWLREKEETDAQMAVLRAKLNAAPAAQSLEELTREYDALKAAGNLAEAFPIGQRIRQLQRQRDSQGGAGVSDGDTLGGVGAKEDEAAAARLQVHYPPSTV